MPIFAIVTATYNRPELIIEALDSVVRQSFDDWVAIVVNDCSTMDYAPVEARFSDSRFIFIHCEENHGTNFARNRGIDKAIEIGAQFIIFLDDDDYLSDDSLEVTHRYIKKYPNFGWFSSNTYGDAKPTANRIEKEEILHWIDDYIHGKKLRGDKNFILASSSIGDLRFNEKYRYGNEKYLYLRISRNTSIVAFPENLKHIKYNESGVTKTKGYGAFKKDNLFQIKDRIAYRLIVLNQRPTAYKSYKYLFLTLFKAPFQALRIVLLNLFSRS